MKTQVICLDSPEIFNLYKAKYALEDNIWHPAVFGIEIRDVSESVSESLVSGIGFSRSVYEPSSLMLTGTLSDLEMSCEKIETVNKSTANDISRTLTNYSGYDRIKFKMGEKEFDFSGCYVMGILNVTPDSFSDGGRYYEREAAIAHALEMIDDGADIIDIGGESTRPGANPVSEEEELDRVLPVIQNIVTLKPDAVISIDTSKSRVAEEALAAGASIVNDVSGLIFDNRIAGTAAKYNAVLVVMHIKGTPRDMQKNPSYDDVISEVYDHLFIQTEVARGAGVNKIIIDPGIGFGKKIEHNYELIKRLKDFKSLGFPVMVGASRKSFIGNYLNLEPGDRDTASAIVDTLALKNGAKIIRTHNVKNGIMIKKLFGRLN